jgi:hypothetical protein
LDLSPPKQRAFFWFFTDYRDSAFFFLKIKAAYPGNP